MSQTWENARARGVAGVGQRSGVATTQPLNPGALAETAIKSADGATTEAVAALTQQRLMENT